MENQFQEESNIFYSRVNECLNSDELSLLMDQNRKETMFEFINLLQKFSSPNNSFGYFHALRDSKVGYYHPVMQAMLNHRLLLFKAHWSMILPEDFVFISNMKKLSEKLVKKLSFKERYFDFLLYKITNGIKFPRYFTIMGLLRLSKIDKKIHSETEFERNIPFYRDTLETSAENLHGTGTPQGNINYRDYMQN